MEQIGANEMGQGYKQPLPAYSMKDSFGADGAEQSTYICKKKNILVFFFTDGGWVVVGRAEVGACGGLSPARLRGPPLTFT